MPDSNVDAQINACLSARLPPHNDMVNTPTQTYQAQLPDMAVLDACHIFIVKLNCFSGSHNRLIADTILCKFPPTFGSCQIHVAQMFIYTCLQDLLQPGSPYSPQKSLVGRNTNKDVYFQQRCEWTSQRHVDHCVDRLWTRPLGLKVNGFNELHRSCACADKDPTQYSRRCCHIEDEGLCVENLLHELSVLQTKMAKGTSMRF